MILEKHKERLQFDKEICEGANLKEIDRNTLSWFKERYEFSIRRKLHLSGMELIKSLGCLFIQENNRITTSQCAGLLNVSNDTALRELSKLRSLGLIKQKGIGRGAYYVAK